MKNFNEIVFNKDFIPIIMYHNLKLVGATFSMVYQVFIMSTLLYIL